VIFEGTKLSGVFVIDLERREDERGNDVVIDLRLTRAGRTSRGDQTMIIARPNTRAD
jgi:hypothetical protein